ncbi:hypothetical protein I3700191H1_12060 [Megasphaera massiliensis]
MGAFSTKESSPIGEGRFFAETSQSEQTVASLFWKKFFFYNIKTFFKNIFLWYNIKR